MKYRHKPVFVDAIQWDETHTTRLRLQELGMEYTAYSGHADRPDECTSLRIGTIDGTKRVEPRDWIVRDGHGRFDVWTPDTFAETFEEEANARLIAAAPELLAMLRTASAALRSYQYHNSSTELAKQTAHACDNLICKADGEMPGYGK